MYPSIGRKNTVTLRKESGDMRLAGGNAEMAQSRSIACCVTPGKEVIALNRAYNCLDQRNRII